MVTIKSRTASTSARRPWYCSQVSICKNFLMSVDTPSIPWQSLPVCRTVRRDGCAGEHVEKIAVELEYYGSCRQGPGTKSSKELAQDSFRSAAVPCRTLPLPTCRNTCVKHNLTLI